MRTISACHQEILEAAPSTMVEVGETYAIRPVMSHGSHNNPTPFHIPPPLLPPWWR